MPLADPTVVLLHSPLTSASAWGELRDALRGLPTVAPEMDDSHPPYAVRWVASAASAVRGAAASGTPVVLVAHSGAGPLLPALGAALRVAHVGVAAYVFVDAVLPRTGRATRLDLVRAEGEAAADELHALLHEGRRFPDWTEEDLRLVVPDAAARVSLLGGLRPRGHDYWTEPLPTVADWPDAPCGYLRTSPPYDYWARVARGRGWPVEELDLGHFAPLVDPDAVAVALGTVISRLGVSPG